MVSENWKRFKEQQHEKQKRKVLNTTKDKADAVDSQKDEGEASLWFEVDAVSLRKSKNEALVAAGNAPPIIDLFPPKKSESNAAALGRYVAMDCEFVGVGVDGTQHALARVSVVNFHGEVLMDVHCKPRERITDYRTAISGVKPEHLHGAADFVNVQKQVADLLAGRIVIGHGLYNDFRVLMLSHPRRFTRDTSKLRKFRTISRGKTPSLRRLCQEFLGVAIHEGAHDSVDDARVAMLLYRSFKDEWENALFKHEGKQVKAAKRERKKQFASNAKEAFLSQLPPPTATSVPSLSSSKILVNMK